eukprot:14493744-Alexandrium_andersonii.AAC.1
MSSWTYGYRMCIVSNEQSGSYLQSGSANVESVMSVVVGSARAVGGIGADGAGGAVGLGGVDVLGGSAVLGGVTSIGPAAPRFCMRWSTTGLMAVASRMTSSA